MYNGSLQVKTAQLPKAQQNEPDTLLQLAIKVATQAHDGQLDKGGNPYILHPKAVADSLDGTDEKIVAYLHDVCEDTETTPEQLERMGFPTHIVNSIRTITKKEGMPYSEYLAAVKDDPIARRVKMADIRHNMDISRIPNPTAKDYARIEKYRAALAFLQDDAQ